MLPDQFTIHLPDLELTSVEKEYFVNLYSELHPINNPSLMPKWRVTTIPIDKLDYNLSFFEKLKTFCSKVNLEIESFDFQIMWAGRTTQLFIHKDSRGYPKYPLIPMRLSWKLIGPTIPLKWYKELQDDPGFYTTNGVYGAWTVRNQKRYEEEAKVLELMPVYPCLLNTHKWHTISQDKVVEEGLRVILSIAFKDNNLPAPELWNNVRNKLGV
jgi:hypothetical protein